MIQKIEFRSMGCHMLAALDAEQDVSTTLEQVPGWFEEWEQALSRFRPDSELSRLNRSNGAAFHASPALWQVLKLSLRMEKESGGLITPLVLDALETAGYSRSFDLLDAASQDFGVDTLSMGTVDDIRMDEGTRTVQLPEGFRLDLGGVAKGWSAHQAMLKLKKWGPALMDSGGDIATSGPLLNGSAWQVAVADPAADQPAAALIGLNGQGVATSGQDYRRWLSGGVWQHHLIDVRTGMPSQTDVLTATVIAPTVMDAEAAAKQVFFLGGDDGLAWVETRPQLSALIQLVNSEQLRSSTFETVLWSRNHEYSI
jgi:thiamine biosynthesis lipoprotein